LITGEKTQKMTAAAAAAEVCYESKSASWMQMNDGEWKVDTEFIEIIGE